MRVFGWGLGGLGWIQPSFLGRSQPVRCLVALLLLGTKPTRFSVWLKDCGQVAPFSVWLKELSVWWESTRLERLRSSDFDERVQPASERNIPPWSQLNPPILQPNSHGNGSLRSGSPRSLTKYTGSQRKSGGGDPAVVKHSQFDAADHRGA